MITRACSLQLLLATAVGLWSSTLAHADGMFAPLLGEKVANTSDQQAILIYGTDWTRLVLRTGYQGDGTLFAWVVPIKGMLSEQDVTTVDPALFRALDQATAPQLLRYDIGCGSLMGCAAEAGEDQATSTPAGVTVFASFNVAEFRISVVRATETADLLAWFEQQGLPSADDLPDNSQEVLGRYIRDQYNFVAVRIDPRLLPGGQEQPDAGVAADAGTGPEPTPAQPVPVRALVMRFAGTMSTFPLHISSLSTKDEAELLLYTIGRGRYRATPATFPTVDMQLPATYEGTDFDSFYQDQLRTHVSQAGGPPAFVTEYAGPVPDPIMNLLVQEELVDNALAEGSQGRQFVTRLRTLLLPAQMDRDVEVELLQGNDSLRQHRVRVIAGYQSEDAGIAAVVPFDAGLILALAGLAFRRRRGRPAPAGAGRRQP